MQRGEGSSRLPGGCRQVGRERDQRSRLQRYELLTASQSCPRAFLRASTKPGFAHTTEKLLASSNLCSLKQLAAAGMGIAEKKGHEWLALTH